MIYEFTAKRRDGSVVSYQSNDSDYPLPDIIHHLNALYIVGSADEVADHALASIEIAFIYPRKGEPMAARKKLTKSKTPTKKG